MCLCLSQGSYSDSQGGTCQHTHTDCTSRSYQDVTEGIYHRSKLYCLCRYIKSFSKWPRVKLVFFLISSSNALNFLRYLLSPLVTQTTPLLANIRMSFCFKLFHFFIFYFGQFLQIVLSIRLDQIPVILAKVKNKKPNKALKNCDFFLLKNVSTNCSKTFLYCLGLW